jgi:hypothetical protein
MEFLCGQGLCSGMMQSRAPVFLQELPPSPVLSRRRHKAVTQDNEPPDDVWPDVSMRQSQDNSAPMNPENAQGRVLFEIFLVLAAAASFAGLATVLIPPGP